MSFKIGEIAIGQNFIVNTECNGMECKILSEYCTSTVFDMVENRILHNVDGYEVRWANGVVEFTFPKHLRKRHEPGNWDDLKDEMGRPIWNPTKIEVKK